MVRWLVAVGNPLRRDDGLGPMIAHEVQALGLPGLRVVQFLTLPVPPPWHPDDRVLVVDAVASPVQAPGTLILLDLRKRPRLPSHLQVSTHGLGFREWLRLIALEPGLPRELCFLGIVGADFGYGTGLSSAVIRTLPRLLQEIQHWVSGISGAHSPMDPLE